MTEETERPSGLYVIKPADDPDGTETDEPTPETGNSGPPPFEAVTAFLVTVDTAGTWMAHLDPEQWGNLAIARAPGLHDVLAACGVLGATAASQINAQNVIQAQMQIAHQAAQQAEAMRIQEALANGQDPFAGQQRGPSPFRPR